MEGGELVEFPWIRLSRDRAGKLDESKSPRQKYCISEQSDSKGDTDFMAEMKSYINKQMIEFSWYNQEIISTKIFIRIQQLPHK